MNPFGLTFEDAMELHRLFLEDCLSPLQISRVTGVSLEIVSGVLSGRYFPGALKTWEKMQ